MKKIFLFSLMAAILFSSAGFAQAYKEDRDKEDNHNKKSLVKVLSPNGGEVYNVGQQMNISWVTTPNNNPNLISRVYLVYTPTNISTTIGSGPASGSFSYTIPTQLETMPGPLPSGKYYKIRVDILNNGRIFATDSSDKNFTINQSIVSSITVVSPNGGEVYQAGQNITVNWTTTNIPADATMSVSVFTIFGDPNAPQGSAILVPNTGSVLYTLPSNLPSGSNYKVRVNLGVMSPVMDFSDGPFTVNSLSSVTVSTDPNTPAYNTILVSNTSNTNNINLFKLNVKAEGSDLQIRKIPVAITSGASANIASVVNTIKLYSDGNLVDSVDGSSGSDVLGGVITNNPCTTTCGFIFSNLDYTVPMSSTKSFTVALDIKALNGNYPNGFYLTGSVSNGDVILPAHFSVLDVNGDQLTPSQRSGFAQGQTQAFATNCLNTVMGSTTTTSTTEINGNISMVTYNIPLTITACGGNRYIGQNAELTTTASGTNALAYVFNTSSNPNIPEVMSIASSVFSSIDAVIEGNGYRIDDGSTKHFTLTVVLITPSTPNSFYRVNLKQVRAFTNGMLTTGATNIDLLPASSYQTQFAFINN